MNRGSVHCTAQFNLHHMTKVELTQAKPCHHTNLHLTDLGFCKGSFAYETASRAFRLPAYREGRGAGRLLCTGALHRCPMHPAHHVINSCIFSGSMLLKAHSYYDT